MRSAVVRTTGSNSLLTQSTLRTSKATTPICLSAQRQQYRRAHAISNPTLANIEKRWETMMPQEQADLWMQLRDRMRTDWKELTLQEKKAGKHLLSIDQFHAQLNIWAKLENASDKRLVDHSILDCLWTSWSSCRHTSRRESKGVYIYTDWSRSCIPHGLGIPRIRCQRPSTDDEQGMAGEDERISQGKPVQNPEKYCLSYRSAR